MNFDMIWSRRNVYIAVILMIGTVAVGNLVQKVLFPNAFQRLATREQMEDIVRLAEERDRQAWEKVWRDRGREPPPFQSHYNVPEGHPPVK